MPTILSPSRVSQTQMYPLPGNPKNLNCVWNANNTFAKLVLPVYFHADSKPDAPLNVSSLVIELEAKAINITDFEQVIKELQEENESGLSTLHEKLCHKTSDNAREIFLKCRIIEKLEALLSENKPKRTRGKDNRKGEKRQKRKVQNGSAVML